MRKILVVALMYAALPLALGTSLAQASYVASIEQVGSNVVTTGSGSINTTALVLEGSPTTVGGAIVAFEGELNLGSLSSIGVDVYAGFQGPTSFGSSGENQASSGSGPLVAVVGGGPGFILPGGYVSGTDLGVSTDTYLDTNIAFLGLTPGLYVWTWGTGATADSFSLQIGPADVGGVPEPEPFALLGIGLVGLAAARRRRK